MTTSDGSTTEGVMTGDSTSDGSTTEGVSTSDGTTTSTTSDSTSDGSTTGEPLICGDGFVDDGEACDDGNNLGGDACTPACEHNPKIVQIACGTLHSCVVLEDGTMRCWGSGASGQLGYGDGADRGDEPDELPTPSVPVGGSVLRASTSGDHTCAVLDTGKVRCWGFASGGALGNGFADGAFGNDPSEVPPADIDVGAPVRDVEAGGGFTCVITEADNVRCWGSNAMGELGYGHTDSLGDEPGELPVPDLELGGPVAQIAAGRSHACAVLKDGTLRCWGNNSFGELGYGDTEDRGDEPGEMPPPPVDVGGPVAQVAISTDFAFTCALRTDGEVRCWGYNQDNSLGTDSVNDVGDEPGEMPPPPVPLAGPATAVSTGATSACALLATGELQCWGSNGHGAVGLPGTITVWIPTIIDVRRTGPPRGQRQQPPLRRAGRRDAAMLGRQCLRAARARARADDRGGRVAGLGRPGPVLSGCSAAGSRAGRRRRGRRSPARSRGWLVATRAAPSQVLSDMPEGTLAVFTS
ncbi:hypothetical protein [Nannocystis pusilla]|uniref:RCC1 domain-containing protein n=1 Tax=Nannocystis pusilla TaxID=889268 RepID=UPI003DA62E55